MKKAAKAGLFLGILQTAICTSVFAQEYRSNLGLIGVTRTLHSDLASYIAGKSNALNVGVAILDGRPDPTHPDLKSSISIHIVYRGTYRRYDSHGTHVSGIAGADANGVGIVGVAPTAKIFAIPVFDDRRWVASDMGTLALSKAVELGAKAVNMSYGPTAPGDVFMTGELNVLDDYSSMVLVRAAGNSGVSMLNEYYFGDASASLANLLIVGSVDANLAISSFSNRPGEACIASTLTCDASDKAKNFFLVAPGRNIYSDLPKSSYGLMSGTSMAAPHVTGAAALVFQNAYAGNVVLSAADVAEILKTTATDLGATGVDGVFGWGLLNVSAALGPVGPLSVSTHGQVGGGPSLRLAQFSQSSVMGASAVLADVVGGMVVFDRFGRGFVMQSPTQPDPDPRLARDALSALNAALGVDAVASLSDNGVQYSMSTGDMLGHFTQASSTQELSLSRSLGSQFFTGAGNVADAVANGFQTGADFTLSPSLTVSALFVQGSEAGNNLASIGAGVALDESRSISLSYGLLSEQDSLLGIRNSGAFSLGSAHTSILGASYSQQLSPGLRADVFAQAGYTQAQPSGQSLFTDVSDVWSAKLGMSLTATDLIQKQDSLQISLTSPWRMLSGDVEARVPVGREFDGTVNYETRKVSMASDAVPLDLGLSYTTEAGAWRYGAALWLRDENAAGLSVDDAAAAAGVSLRF